MRILMWTSFLRSTYGGLETFLQLLVPRLAALGHEIVIADEEFEADIEEEQVRPGGEDRPAAPARNERRGDVRGAQRRRAAGEAAAGGVRPAPGPRLQGVSQPVLSAPQRRAAPPADALQPARRARGPAGRSADAGWPDAALGRLDRGLLERHPRAPDRARAGDPAPGERGVQRHAGSARPDRGALQSSSAARLPGAAACREGLRCGAGRGRPARRSVARPGGGDRRGRPGTARSSRLSRRAAGFRIAFRFPAGSHRTPSIGSSPGPRSSPCRRSTRVSG